MKKRGLFKNKKADSTHEIYQIVIELVLLSLIAVSIFSYISSINDSTITEKIFLSRDIALTANTIQSLPGNVHYVYTDDKADLSKFMIDTRKHISVKEEDGNEVDFPYIKNVFLAIDLEYIEKSPTINLNKAGDEFIISSDKEISLNKFSCIDIDTRGNVAEKKILLIYSDEKTQEAARHISQKINAEVSDIVVSSEYDIILKLISGDKTMAISAANNHVLKGKKLSCLIANKVLDVKPTEDFIIGFDDIYSENNLYVELTFKTSDGNIMADKISEAIVDYYG